MKIVMGIAAVLYRLSKSEQAASIECSNYPYKKRSSSPKLLSNQRCVIVRIYIIISPGLTDWLVGLGV